MLWDLGLKVGHATRTVERVREARRARTSPSAPRCSRRADPAGDETLSDELRARFRQRRRRRHGARVRRRQARRARRAPRPRRRSPLPGRAQRQGGQGRPARPADAVLDRQVPLPRRRNDGAGRCAACSRAEEYAPSSAAATSSGRCAAICTSSPAGPRSGCPSTCSRRSRGGWATRRIRGLRAVERFMRHYFLVAKDVGDLTRIFWPTLEERAGRRTRRGSTASSAASARAGACSSGTSDFVVEHGPHQRRRARRLRARSGQPDPHLPRCRAARPRLPPRRPCGAHASRCG